MKRAVIIGGAVVGAVLLARRLASTLKSIDWEKRITATPGNVPPKWMFSNIKAIRENTDRILELLQRQGELS